MEGKVIKSTGSWYNVRTSDGKIHNCRVRGKIRLEGIKETNPVAVGDHVEFETNQNTINKILSRKNQILRKSVKKTGHTHVLAANVDQVLLIATLAHPRTSLGFIDRFLVAAESFRIPQILLFNKGDLLKGEAQDFAEDLIAMYQKIVFRCQLISAVNDDLSFLKELLTNKVTLMAGHSGVGKSTLINRLTPEINQKIGAVSTFSNKGVHTTTFAEMFEVFPGSFIIDTPGIKEWGLADMTPEEISDYFPEMRDHRLDCKFGSRCIHLHEPQCAIIEAVKKGDIDIRRYESYLSIISDEDNRK